MATIDTLQTTIENLTKVLETQTKNLSKQETTNFLLSQVYFEGLTQLTATLRNVVSLQEKSLSIGSSLFDILGKNEATFREIPGGVAGALGVQVGNIVAGLAVNSKQITLLTARAKLLGESDELVRSGLITLKNTLGFTDSHLESLSLSLIDNSETYKIQTSKLISNIQSLANEFAAFTQVGFGEDIVKLNANLTSRFGPSLAQSVTQALRAVVTPDMASLERAVRLGYTSQLELLLASRSEQEQTRLFVEIIKQASKTIKGYSDDFTGLAKLWGPSILNKTFGIQNNQVAAILALEMAIQKGITSEDRLQLQLGTMNQSLTALKFELLQPLVTTLTPVLQGVTNFLSENRELVKVASQALLSIAAVVASRKFVRLITLIPRFLSKHPAIAVAAAVPGILSLLGEQTSIARETSEASKRQLELQEKALRKDFESTQTIVRDVIGKAVEVSLNQPPVVQTIDSEDTISSRRDNGTLMKEIRDLLLEIRENTGQEVVSEKKFNSLFR